jgi:hypothetical protein
LRSVVVAGWVGESVEDVRCDLRRNRERSPVAHPRLEFEHERLVEYLADPEAAGVGGPDHDDVGSLAYPEAVDAPAPAAVRGGGGTQPVADARMIDPGVFAARPAAAVVTDRQPELATPSMVTR